MKKKKVVAIAAAAVLAATSVGALAGCGESADINLDILLLANKSEGTFYRDYFKQMEKDFEKEGLSVSINYRGYEEDDYYKNLDNRDTQDNMPDIFYVRPNEILKYKDKIISLQSYAETQKEVDLSTIYQTALDLYRYNPTTGALSTHDGELYAFPKDLSTQQLGYNKELLETVANDVRTETGLKMPYDIGFEGYTWAEYKEVCVSVANHLPNKTGWAASDVPSLEILAKSFSDDKSVTTSPLIDMSNGRANATVNSFTEGAIKKAIDYQQELISSGAANHMFATYSNFTGKKVCFYGAVGSWEVKDYNQYIGEDKWGVMPWPTVTHEDTKWQGLITSAGYVVSKDCDAAKETTTDEDGNTYTKSDIAKRIAISFLSSKTQNKLMKGQISLPLIEGWAKDYTSSENDDQYAPKTRSVFMDVISGEHGFFPAKYSTYDKDWLYQLETKNLPYEKMLKGEITLSNDDLTAIVQDMQTRYNKTKDKA